MRNIMKTSIAIFLIHFVGYTIGYEVRGCQSRELLDRCERTARAMEICKPALDSCSDGFNKALAGWKACEGRK